MEGPDRRRGLTPVKIFMMLGFFHDHPNPSPVVTDALGRLRHAGYHVDVGFADQSLTYANCLNATHDLYVLKSHSDYWLSMAGALHRLGAPLLDSYAACLLTRDKFVVTQHLRSYGVPVPATWLTG